MEKIVPISLFLKISSCGVISTTLILEHPVHISGTCMFVSLKSVSGLVGIVKKSLTPSIMRQLNDLYGGRLCWKNKKNIVICNSPREYVWVSTFLAGCLICMQRSRNQSRALLLVVWSKIYSTSIRRSIRGKLHGRVDYARVFDGIFYAEPSWGLIYFVASYTLVPFLAW